MPVEPGRRTSPVSDSTTLNSVCRIGGPTEPRTLKKNISLTLSYNVPLCAEKKVDKQQTTWKQTKGK